MSETMLAWHFLNDDGTTGYGGLKPQVGEKLVHGGELELCESGLHFSLKALDALDYAPGAVVCRVEVGGEIIMGNNKGVARERTILWKDDATSVLHEFACRCAEDTLNLIPEAKRGVFVAAIAAKRAWVRGEITDAELAAMRDAARVTERDAARDAAGAAAQAAARAAARAAAWAAAGAAAWAAAGAAAGAAARAAQNERLERMLNELMGLGETEVNQ